MAPTLSASRTDPQAAASVGFALDPPPSPGLRAPLALPLRARAERRSLAASSADGVPERRGAAPVSLTALTLENARLHRAEQRLRRQWQIVRGLTAQITRELDLEATLELVTRSLRPLLGHGTGSVWLWDEARGALAPAGRGDAPADSPALRLGASAAEVVAATRRPLLVNDCRRQPGAGEEPAAVTALIAEPLRCHDRFLGVLVVAADDPRRPFTAEDAEMLQFFAGYASIALANAQLFAQIQADHAHLQQLSLRLVEAQEAERRSLARELHDEIGQTLTGLHLLLEVSSNAPAPRNRRGIEAAQELVRGLLSRVRQLSLDLRPSMLDDLGLPPALAWLVEHYQARTGIRVEFRHAGLEGRLPPEVETAAYRVVQEALTNVARHAGAPEARVSLCLAQDVLQVQVEDRGCGFDPTAAPPHTSTGLQGMRERAALLGGRLTVDSAPGRGTCITALLPLAPWAAAGGRAAA